MCKIMAIAGVKKKHHEKVKEITRVMANIIARTDDDGFGYAAITTKGTVFGEKWLKATDVLQPKPKPEPGIAILTGILGAYTKFKGQSSTPSGYARFGALTKENIDDSVAIIFHGRKKTFGEKSIVNTHPFFEAGDKMGPDVALIHNGSIFNHLSLTKKYSTCDSETILHEYIKNYMWYNQEFGMKTIAETLKGEYAVGALSSILYDNGTIAPYLDIFKSSKDLFAAYAQEIEAVIYTTSEHGLAELATKCGLTLSGLTEVPDGVLLRLNAITGQLLEEHVPFKISDKYTIYSPPGKATVLDKPPFSDLYTQNYHQFPEGLTEVEKKHLEELEKNPATNFKALQLVKLIAGVS